MSDEFVRVCSPGLPNWPPLWLNQDKKHAKVSARIVTWRSCEWAKRSIRWAVNLAGCWLSIRFWYRIPEFSGKWFPWLMGTLAIVFVLAILYPVIDLVIRNFLARRLFARRMTVWFTPTAIAFRSGMYPREVIVPRYWGGLPIVFRFDQAKDDRAQFILGSRTAAERTDCNHLEKAQIIRLIIQVTNPNDAIATQGQLNVMRSIPLSEIQAADADQLTTVLTAAAAVTSGQPDDLAQTPPDGVDIDEYLNPRSV